MRAFLARLSLGVLIALTIPTIFAQHRLSARDHLAGGGPPALMLLAQQPIQEELKLSAEQIEKITAAHQALREEFQKTRESAPEERQAKLQELKNKGDKLAAGILTADQAKRVQQISWQLQNTRAFALPDVAAALNLTEDQNDKIKTIHEDTSKEIAQLFAADDPPSREEARKAIVELHKKADAKAIAILSDEQKSAWQEMQGEQFKGELHFGPNR
jgi:Spy/CpxP family protein refolding chaperone